LRKDLAAALEEFKTLAGQLSAKRATAGRALSKDISTRMQSLGMAGGRFQVDVTQDGTQEPAQHGVDQIEFRVTANPGQPLRPLSKVASGGELSRLSLAVQVSVAARETRCMVFDEVDSGIGGAIAEIVGRELRSLGERGQVLCVTHLPQVASQGHHHLRVAKSTDGRTTRTSLTELAATDRVEEIARMLGGVEVTGKAREHAKEMLRTHLELPPDPTPTDRMPALKVKGVLAQAKVAAQEGKDPGVEPKSLGVDPRATAVGLRTAGDQKAAGGGTDPRVAGGGNDARVAAGGSLRGAPGANSGAEAKGADGKATAAAKGGAKANAADAKVSAGGESKPATKGAKDNDKIIDLNAAKAAGRPASKRR